VIVFGKLKAIENMSRAAGVLDVVFAVKYLNAIYKNAVQSYGPADGSWATTR